MANNSFFKGIIFGATVGAVGALLLAPKSGKETREDIKKFAKETSKDATAMYEKARKEVESRIAVLKKTGKKLDAKKYSALISEVVAEFKNDAKVTSEVGKKLSNQLKNDWKKVSSSLSNKEKDLN